MNKIRAGVLISGNGSNLQALIDAAQCDDFPASIALVISNQAGAYGLTRAQQAGVATRIISHTDYSAREMFDEAMHAELLAHGVQLVCLAGFMRLLSPRFVAAWEGRMLNIHPSLLPQFKGAHAIRDALAAGVKETGCTVHLVTEELDAGPILQQARVPVLVGDTEDTLRARIHTEEHRIYPEALRQLAVSLRSHSR